MTTTPTQADNRTQINQQIWLANQARITAGQSVNYLGQINHKVAGQGETAEGIYKDLSAIIKRLDTLITGYEAAA